MSGFELPEWARHERAWYLKKSTWYWGLSKTCPWGEASRRRYRCESVLSLMIAANRRVIGLQPEHWGPHGVSLTDYARGQRDIFLAKMDDVREKFGLDRLHGKTKKRR